MYTYDHENFDGSSTIGVVKNLYTILVLVLVLVHVVVDCLSLVAAVILDVAKRHDLSGAGADVVIQNRNRIIFGGMCYDLWIELELELKLYLFIK